MLLLKDLGRNPKNLLEERITGDSNEELFSVFLQQTACTLRARKGTIEICQTNFIM